MIEFEPERRTSKLGKASLMIAVIIFLLVVLSAIGLIVMFQTTKTVDAVVIVTVIGWVLAPSGHFIGLVFGVIDVCRSRSKKLVPALGIAGNAVLGGIGFAILIGIVNSFLKTAGGFH